MRATIFTLFVVLLLGGCASAAETQPATATAPATRATLQPIRYQRTGGFAGTNDVIEITADGAVVVQGKLMGQPKGQLTAAQIQELVPLFKEWEKYDVNYPAPRGSADGFELKIRYGGKEVAASELNRTLPATFQEICRALEKIAAELKAKAKT